MQDLHPDWIQAVETKQKHLVSETEDDLIETV